MSRIVALLALSMLVPAVAAEEFAWQMSGSRQQIDFRGGGGIDTNALDATYFFESVDDTLGPYALAPFLGRHSRVTVTAQHTQAKQIISYLSPIGGQRVFLESTDESDEYAVSGRHVWRNTGWYVGGGLQYQDPSGTGTSSAAIDIDQDGYTLIGGKYVARSTALELMFRSTRRTMDSVPVITCANPFLCGPGPVLVDSKHETDDVGLSVVHVGGGRGLRYAVSGQAVASETTFSSRARLIGPIQPFPTVPNIATGGVVTAFGGTGSVSLPTQREYSVRGELFPTARLGVRLGYTSFSNRGQLDDRYELATTWFFKRKIAAEFLIAQTNFGFGVSGAAQDEARIRIIGRL